VQSYIARPPSWRIVPNSIIVKIQDDRDSHIEFRETSISPDFMKTTVSEALEAN